MSLLYLYLGHLLGDFIFQPEKLVIWKQQNWKGIALHAIIHFLTEVLLFVPFMVWGGLSPFNFVLVALFVAGMHFFIDRLKIRMEKKDNHYLKLYLFDQFLHLLVITVASLFIPISLPTVPLNIFASFYFNPFIIAYFIGLILLSYAYEITLFQIQREDSDKKTFKIRLKDILIRTVIFSLLYWVVFWILWHQVAFTLS